MLTHRTGKYIGMEEPFFSFLCENFSTSVEHTMQQKKLVACCVTLGEPRNAKTQLALSISASCLCIVQVKSLDAVFTFLQVQPTLFLLVRRDNLGKHQLRRCCSCWLVPNYELIVSF